MLSCDVGKNLIFDLYFQQAMTLLGYNPIIKQRRSVFFLSERKDFSEEGPRLV